MFKKKLNTVSVIIPTYNRWPYVCSAIDSVLHQSYDYTECIVVDDASNDDTPSLLSDKYGSKIKIISQNVNQGQSVCRNIGAEESKSDCICFLDSDDIFYPQAVEERVSLLNDKSNQVRASFGLFRKSASKNHSLLNKKKRGEVLLLEEYLQNKNWCNNNGFLIYRDNFLQDGLYNPLLRNKEDIELLLRLLSKHDFRYCGVEIGMVRNISDGKRARNDYNNIVNQVYLFTKIVSANPQLRKIISNSNLNNLICSDAEETLRALYKLGRYTEFRSFYKLTKQNKHILNTKRFFKRYIFSYIRQIF